jgi:hypothetical protein
LIFTECDLLRTKKEKKKKKKKKEEEGIDEYEEREVVSQS